MARGLTPPALRPDQGSRSLQVPDGWPVPLQQPRPLPHPLIPEIETLAQQVAESAGFQVCGVQLLTHRIPMTLQVQVRLAPMPDLTIIPNLLRNQEKR